MARPGRTADRWWTGLWALLAQERRHRDLLVTVALPAAIMVVGAAASEAGPFLLGWIFVVAWLMLLVVTVMILRTCQRRGLQILAFVFMLFSAVVLLGLYRLVVAHAPHPPPSTQEIADVDYQEFCKNSPWLCQKPASGSPTTASVGYRPNGGSHCQVTVSESARPFARYYGFMDSGSSGKANFAFQQLFVEWSADISVDNSSKIVDVDVTDILPKDSVHVDPPDATRSARKPEWMSGFREAAHPTPDFFSQLITTRDLPEGAGVHISIRRSLLAPEIGASELPSVDEARNEGCSATLPHAGYQVAAKLTKDLEALASRRNGPAPLPLGNDPGVLPGQIEVTVDKECDGPDCRKQRVYNLEVRKNDKKP